MFVFEDGLSAFIAVYRLSPFTIAIAIAIADVVDVGDDFSMRDERICCVSN